MIKLCDVFQAYFNCKKNKSKNINALKFELDYEDRILKLYDDIILKKYEVGKSIAFIVDKPCKREIFAGDFRDRIVHHLIYNKINGLFEKNFIFDSYSCRLGKGVLFGIKRVDKFFKKASKNYKKQTYVMKIDISGFFMNIDKNILFEKLKFFLEQKYFEDDKDIILYLIEKIIFNDPTRNCIIKGNIKNWEDLPKHKSIFFNSNNKGLPIGNLTSQIFGNFYLNEIDHFIKCNLQIKYYGRYVDDMIFVHNDKNKLLEIKEIIETKLLSIGLKLNSKKFYLQDINKGVSFLGAYIKPYNLNIGKRIKGNIYDYIRNININYDKSIDIRPNINSYLGIIKHYSSYLFRKKILFSLKANYYNDYYISDNYQKIKCKKRIRDNIVI